MVAQREGKAATKGGDAKGGDAPPDRSSCRKAKRPLPMTTIRMRSPGLPLGGNGGLTATDSGDPRAASGIDECPARRGRSDQSAVGKWQHGSYCRGDERQRGNRQLPLERGADVNLANAQGWTPLYSAIKSRTMEKGTMPNPLVDKEGLCKAIEFMIAHGVDVNARIRGNTEVHNGIAATWLREAGATAFSRARRSAPTFL